MESVQEMLQRLGRAGLNDQAVNIERTYFYKTDKKVNPRQENPFRFFQGNIPILISAPHAVRHVRKREIKKSDEYTGSIAFLLNQLADCHVLAVTKLYGGDPNDDWPCIYKELLTSLCREHKIKLLLDLHGAAREREFDIAIGTAEGQSLLGQKQVLDLLLDNLKAAGLSRISQSHFQAKGPNTVTNYVFRELGIPAVQLEVNRKFRVPAQNPHDFHRLLAGLSSFINGVKLLNK